jgi:site-specific DNA-methyltransferase (adenine-specific)
MVNNLYYGDNLNVLRSSISNESVDLIYLDPPFNSNANYNVLFQSPKGLKSEAQIEAFKDTWHWTQDAEQAYDEVMQCRNSDVSEMLYAIRKLLKENDMMAYITMMAVRLIELHRVLKSNGSLYLHCDSTASHYLKILLDAIFGKKNFKNEIVWKRTHAHNSSNRYGKNTDKIFYYTKSDNYTFNKFFLEYSEKYKKDFFKYTDERGVYREVILTGSGISKGKSDEEWKGYIPSKSKRHWSVPKRIVNQLVGEDRANSMSIIEKLDLLFEHNYIIFSKNGIPSFKQYIDDMEGAVVQELWTDINPLSAQSKEKLGYPTQKPVSLLERIIEVSSNENDVILDPFCGCGTTIHAAEKLRRRWIGIDITHLSISLIEKRLHDAFSNIQFEIHGTPKDISGAEELALKDKYQFQWWAISLVNAVPYGGKKKGADGGIDGIIYFKPDGRKTEKAIVSVKGGQNVSVSMIRDFAHVIEREEAKIGIFITLALPTEPMVKEAIKEGFYKTEFGQYPKIQIITINELFNGKKPSIPLIDNSVFNKPEKEMLAEQKKLDL